MRAPLLALIAALLLGAASAQAQTTRSRAPGAVPPIMVEESTRAERQAVPFRKLRPAETRAPRRDARRARSRTLVPAPVISPLPSRAGELGAIDRSLSVQGQVRGLEQQNQFELNQLRQQIQRNQLSPIGGSLGGGPLGCPAGSIGC